MDPLKQRIAIAEACGWKSCYTGEHITGPFGLHPVSGKEYRLPDYLNDLNAMHEAEKVLNVHYQREYAIHLSVITGADIESGDEQDVAAILHATAAQRAEAFRRTLGIGEGE